jgi:hypothetical protein
MPRWLQTTWANHRGGGSHGSEEDMYGKDVDEFSHPPTRVEQAAMLASSETT